MPTPCNMNGKIALATNASATLGKATALCLAAVGLEISLINVKADGLEQTATEIRGLVEIDNVAEMVAFLASDAASGYHGACINIDNGITAG